MIYIMLLAGAPAFVPLAAVLRGGLAARGAPAMEMFRHGEPPVTADPLLDELRWMTNSKLPSLDELREACFMVAEGEEHNLFLCATPNDEAEQKLTGVSCRPDAAFSKYYNAPVYLCPGGYSLA